MPYYRMYDSIHGLKIFSIYRELQENIVDYMDKNKKAKHRIIHADVFGFLKYVKKITS